MKRISFIFAFVLCALILAVWSHRVGANSSASNLPVYTSDD